MTCSLDDRALTRQLERFEQIGRHATSTRRDDNQLTLTLAAGLDENLLQETLAIDVRVHDGLAARLAGRALRLRRELQIDSHRYTFID